jgi:hypothetical protein
MRHPDDDRAALETVVAAMLVAVCLLIGIAHVWWKP